MLLGVLILLLWLANNSTVYLVAGVMVTVVGTFLVLLGAFSLLQFRRYAKLDQRFSKKKITTSTLLASTLLLSNFPAAATCVVLSGIADSNYVVIIQNDSALPLRNIRLEAASETIHMDTILPGDSALCTFSDIGEWDLTLHAVHGTEVVEQVLDEYTTNLDTVRRVTLLADGSFRIQWGRPHHFSD